MQAMKQQTRKRQRTTTGHVREARMTLRQRHGHPQYDVTSMYIARPYHGTRLWISEDPPDKASFREMKELGITHLISMNKEQPKTRALVCHSFVFPDKAQILDEAASEETLREAVAMCVSLVRSGHGVCVNCSAGVNRSSLVVALAAQQLLPHITISELIQLLRDAKQARCQAWQTFDGNSGQAFERFCLCQSVRSPDNSPPDKAFDDKHRQPPTEALATAAEAPTAPEALAKHVQASCPAMSDEQASCPAMSEDARNRATQPERPENVELAANVHLVTADQPGGSNRAKHVTFRLGVDAAGDRAALYGASGAVWPSGRCLSRPCDGGTTTAAYNIYKDASGDTRIGVMVAANSGRPGGACGARGSVRSVHCGHRTQEEDVFSNWLLSTAGSGVEAQNALFQSTIDVAWGLRKLKSCDHLTFQGVDYVNATDARCFADAWVVNEGQVCVKSQTPKAFHPQKCAPVVLVFSAGPNAGACGSKEGSMCRTLNTMACNEDNYDFFRGCVKEAVRTGLDAMMGAGCDVALVARLSCGIYAGPHRDRINQEFVALVDELLGEEVVAGRTRSTYFRLIDVPMLL